MTLLNGYRPAVSLSNNIKTSVSWLTIFFFHPDMLAAMILFQKRLFRQELISLEVLNIDSLPSV